VPLLRTLFGKISIKEDSRDECNLQRTQESLENRYLPHN